MFISTLLTKARTCFSRLSGKFSYLLDVMITNNLPTIRDSRVLSFSLSDHEMIYCIRKLNWMKALPEIEVFRNYAKYDPVKFGDELKGVDWNCEQDPSETSEENEVCVDEFNCPWMTGNIKRDIRQRDYLLKKARKTSRDEDWLAYKSMRNRVSNSVKKEKQTYNKKLSESHQEDARAFWRTMRTILPGKRSQLLTKLVILMVNFVVTKTKSQTVSTCFSP